ncbi:MAG: hypothetical protein JO199_12145, partial [Candidatus Eremiobacteraeota bacterium]|nr:hypothetical protein [Candidatus Eremiobacteraeota bacterium]
MVTLARRASFAVLVLLANTLLCSAAAPAAVEMSTGIRYVIPTGPVSECSSKAAAALNAYMQTATEATPGSGEWLAFGPQGGVGSPTSAAAVHCYAAGQGYVVTFTCVVQIPENPYTANDLCLDVAHNFSGKPVTPLATPKPLTGCATTNLVGTWQSDDKPSLSFTMTVDGELTDSDG